MTSSGDKLSGLRLLLLYGLLALLAFPILETLLLGRAAPHYAFDVFDDGAFTHLGAVRLDWRAHGPVLWNPHLTAGNAYFAQFTASPLALDSLLALLLPPFLVYALVFLLIVATAGLAMHLFLTRSLHLSTEASVAGSLIYLFGFWNYANGFSVTLLPLMLWLSDGAERPVRRRSTLLVFSALLAAFLFYNANAQAAVLVSGLHLAYALVASESRGKRLARLRFWAFAWAVGLALYGPVIVTQLRLIPDSVRSIRDLAALPGMTAAVGDWLKLYAVVPLGAPALAGLGVPPKAPPYGTWYVGPLGLAILALSWGMKPRTRRERLVASLLLAIPLFDLLATTALPRLQEHFGFLRSFQFIRVRLFLPFALSAGVAVGLERLRSKVWSFRGHRKWWIAAAVAFLLFPGFLCARVLFYLIRRHGLPGHGTSEWGRLAGYAGAALYFGLWALFCFFLVSRSSEIALFRGLRRALNLGARLDLRPGMALLLTLLLLDRIIYQRIERYVDYSRLAGFDEALGETPAIRFLRAQPNPHAHRILMFADRSRWNGADHPNKLMYWGLYAADGYQNVYPLRYHEVFGLLTRPHLEDDPARFRYYHGWGQRAYAFGPEINFSIASLMGIRWFYARGVSLPEGAWREIFRKDGEAVYENPSVLPRAFVAPRIRSFPNRKSLLPALEQASLQELRTTAFVEDKVPEMAGPGAAENASAESVVWRRYTPDHISFEVRSDTGGIFILTDTFVPGWRAHVDGRERRVFPVDGCFRGVSVPAGSSEVALDYSPAYTHLGVWIALAGLATLGAVAVLGETRGSVTVGQIRLPATGDHRVLKRTSKV
jgi:hypothetical protein